MTKHTYTEMVDSGIEWIGKIPKGWEVRKLKYISKCFDNMRRPLNGEERGEVEGEGNIPYYGANGIVDYIGDYIFDDDIVLVGEDGAPFLDKTKDITFNITGKCWVNNHAHILKGTVIKNKYLTHCLNKVDYSLLVGGSTREKLTQGDLMSIGVPLPPLTTQQTIAAYLDTKTAQIEQAISLKTQQISLLREKRSTLINHVVTKGLDPDVELIDSGIEWIGMIPKGWEVRKLKYCASIDLGKMLTPSNPGDMEEKQYLRAQNIGREKVNVDDVSSMRFSKNELNRLRLNYGDLLVSEGGEVGRTAIWLNELEECYIQNSVNRVCFSENFNSKFMLYVFETCGKSGFFDSIVNRVSIAHLTREKLKEIYVIYPSIEEQQAIASYLDDKTVEIDQTIALVQQSIDLLVEYKQSLISHVVTGKVRVG